MKRLLILLSILVCFGIGGSASAISLIGSGIESGTGCQSGTWTFAYNGDHPTGTNYACDSAQAALEGTVVDATVSADYVEYSGIDDYIKWTIDSSEMSYSAGTLYASFYLVTSAGDCPIIEIYVDANNYIVCSAYDQDDRIICYFMGSSTVQGHASDNSSTSADTWLRLGYSWQTGADAGGKHSISVVAEGAPSWGADSNEDLDDWTSAADSLVLGEDQNPHLAGPNITGRIRNVAIVSGYQGTDPF